MSDCIGNPHAPWGIGTIVNKQREAIDYGFVPADFDPELFCPDYEACTEQEIANYRAALKARRGEK